MNVKRGKLKKIAIEITIKEWGEIVKIHKIINSNCFNQCL